MYEFHGWITVRETYENRDIEDAVLDGMIDEIKSHIIKLEWTKYIGVLDIRPQNGAFHIWVSGFPNHKPTGEYCPIAFFEYVGKIAPGSYGILYTRDSDAMINDDYNKFNVYALVRGKLIKHEDPFLSPVMPTIESFPMD